MTFVAAAHYDNSSSSSAAVNKPAGTVDNDIIFAHIKRIGEADPTTVPSGWALLGKDYSAGTGVAHWLYWKLAASEGASYTWGWAAAARTGITNAAYRDGFNTAGPIDVVSNTAYTTNDTILRAAGMTVAAANSPLIFFGATHLGTANTFTPATNPATFVEDVDTWNGDSRFAREIASVVWTGSGATGNMDAAINAANAAKHAFAVALNPAVAGGATPHHVFGKMFVGPFGGPI